MDTQKATLHQKLLIAAEKQARWQAARLYTCPNIKPEYGSKCSYLAGHHDDHTPCPGCPIFQPQN